MSVRRLTARAETWPIRGSFRIARGAKNEAKVVVAEIGDGNVTGRGECVPYARYGETVESALAAIERARDAIEGGATRAELQRLMAAGAARNALDCALIDAEAKASGRPAHVLLGLPPPKPVRTAFTISLAPAGEMAAAAEAAVAKGYDILKLKVADGGDVERVAAVRGAAPHAQLIADANEGWALEDLERFAPALAKLGVALIEQPLKAEKDEALTGFDSPVLLCADESCHTREDLAKISGRYGAINIKLDKAGGLTEAAALARAATAQGLAIMVGCMVATSLAMAPAALLAPFAQFVDLDGPLLLGRDREPGLVYERNILHPPSPALWG